jgi:predicted Zn-dependent protease
MHSKRHLSHAQGYLALGMVEEAAAEIERITGPDAQSLQVISVRLAVLHEQKNWPVVRDVASELICRTPDEPSIWVTWAYATRRADSLAAAEKILLNAERHHPTDPTIQFNLGCYACQRGDLVEAQTRVDRAIALDKNFAELAATDPDLAPLRERKGTDCQPWA